MKRIAVLVSGGGTNLQALIDAQGAGAIQNGTIAAVLSSSPAAYALERAARAGALAARLHREFLEGCVGETYSVLFEQPVAGRYGGHAPNYMEVAVPGGENLHNQVLPVRITGTDGEILLGEVQ